MTLKSRLLGALGVLTIKIAIVIVIFYWSARGSEAALRTVLADRVVPLKDLKLVADSYAVLIVDSAHKARNGNISFADAARNVEHGHRDLTAAWKRYSATDIKGEEKQLAARVLQSMARADAGTAKMESILRAGDRAALDRFVVGELYADIDPISAAIGKLVDLQIDIASTTTNDALADARLALTGVLALGLLSVVVLIAAFLIVTRKVIAPVTELSRVIGDLANQSGEATVPHLDRRDEIGDISRSVDAFLMSVVTKERDKAAADAAVQTLVTSNLSLGLSALARGDLTSRIDTDFPASYESLKQNFNEAIGSLRDLIGAVSESATTIRTGSGEIAQASEDLARRTESNAASLEETAASVTQMDGRLRASAGSAARTVERADQAIATVGGGRAVADEAVQAMGRVSESAKGIDSVIEGLDKIAFQTRVLAMNAAVEAGRAGDAGRGFAVVADLVSALAMRAEEEAKRARDQLTVTQTDIVTAVEAVTKVDGALANISGDVAQVHELLATMAADNQAQSAAITQISAAIGTMDQSTQQNAAMVEETSAAARNLASEVGNLADQASRFKVAGGGGRPAVSRKPDYVTPAAYTSPIKPLPAAAIPAMVRADDDDWKSF